MDDDIIKTKELSDLHMKIFQISFMIPKMIVTSFCKN